ncbi:hypothetical protein [uncultured Psychroserpens sp.]|nr:hypothetical protein [uncultured Psychroserpens sp.]
MADDKKDGIKRPEKDIKIDKGKPKFKEVLTAFVKKKDTKSKN